MAEITSKILKSQIDSNSLSNLYFLYGNEKYRLRLTVNKLSKYFDKISFPQFNFSEFSSDSTVDQIADSAMALPFMAEKKIIIVNDYNIDTLNSSDFNKLNELIEECPDTTTIFFILQTIEIDIKKSSKWKNFIKLVNSKGDILNYENLTEGDLVKFILKTCTINNSTISKYHASKIIEYVGNDMTNLKNETEKLCAYAQNREIILDDIEKLTIKSIDTTVFILIKSIISNNYQKAYELLDILFTLGEEPVPILARIIDNYVDLYRVRAAIQSGKNSLSPSKYGEYKGREFRLRNAERDIRNISTETLTRCMELLIETDTKLKSSKTKGKVVLEELIAKLLIINKRV